MALFLKLSKENYKGRNNPIVLIFDVGSGSIGAALVQLRKAAKPVTIYSTRIELPFTRELQYKHLLTSMLSSFKEVARAVASEKKIHHTAIKEIHCIFSSPWHISQTRVLKASNSKPIIVDEKYLQKIIDECSSDPSPLAESKAHLDPIEQRVIQVRLNGYETANPFGKEAHQIDISLFTTMLSREVRLKLHKVISSHFDTRDIRYHSFPLAAYSAIRDTLRSSTDFLFIDIGGEVTDISLIRAGVLIETVSIPFGRNGFLRNLTKASGGSLPETLSSLKFYTEGNLSNSEGKKLHELFTSSERMWITLFGEALRGLSNESSVPQKIFLSAASDIGSIFGSFIDSDEFRQYTLIDQRFLIVLMERDNVELFTEIAPGVETDTLLALYA